jgi:UDP-N-acetylglucosamine 2-epimerase
MNNFKNKTIITITGIRPDFIRMSSIFKKLDEQCNHICIHTGQHYDNLLSGVFFDELEIRKPDFILETGKHSNGKHYGQLSYLSTAIVELIEKENLNPDLILFLGDSNSACAALPLKKEGYKIGHIEAGMRSFDKRMLEEINRTICDHCSDIHFVYHEDYKKYLHNENLNDHVYVVGNTIVEVVKPFIPTEPKKKDMILIDIHRPENFRYQERMCNIIKYGNLISEKYGLPVKMLEFGRTTKAIKEYNIDLKNIILTPLKSFKDYINCVYNCRFIISDSGTAQEEPALLNTPVIVPRDFTERPQSVYANNSFMLDVNYYIDNERMNINFLKSLEWIQKYELGELNIDTTWLGEGNTSELIVEKLNTILHS